MKRKKTSRLHIALLSTLALCVLPVVASGVQAGGEAGSPIDRAAIFANESIRLFKAGNYQQAMLRFTVLSERFPLRAYFWSYLSRCYLELKENRDALGAADIAISLEPDVKRHYLYRGNAAYRLDDFNGAIQDLRNYLVDYPSHGKAHLLLGMSYLNLNQLEEAEKEMKQARELSTVLDSMVDYQLSVIALRRGEMEQGVQLLRKSKSAVAGTPFGDTMQRQIEYAEQASKGQQPTSRNWTAFLSVGLEYTDNVLGLSSAVSLPSSITDNSDFAPYTIVQGRYRLFTGERQELWLTGTAHYRHYLELDDLDSLQLTPQLEYLFSMKNNWRFESKLDYSYYSVDSDKSSDSIHFSQKAYYSWNNKTRTSLNYLLSFTDFTGLTTPEENRDGQQHFLGLGQTYLFAGSSNVFLNVDLVGIWNSTDGTQHDYSSYNLSTSLGHDVLWNSQLRYGLVYAKIDYDHLQSRAEPAYSSKRSDDISTASIIWSKRIDESWTTSLNYSYKKNSSNILSYDYDKNTVMLSFSYFF